MSVVSLADFKRERTPHQSGKARCLVCKHEWMGVAPTGTFVLECPECHLLHGHFEGYCDLPETAEVFNCNYCNSQLFRVLPEGIFCIGCGVIHPWNVL